MKKLTRVEIISKTNGRLLMYNAKDYFNGDIENIEYALQDDNKTLKIFID